MKPTRAQREYAAKELRKMARRFYQFAKRTRSEDAASAYYNAWNWLNSRARAVGGERKRGK